jgi:hypothetical protein
MTAYWIVERTVHPRFPYRIRIEQEGRPLLAVRAQDLWPGPGAQIFCLRESTFDPAEPLEAVERVPVAALSRLGRKLSVTLDRPTRKRCDFLKIDKPSADGTRTREHIYFRTESGMRAHRSSNRVELIPRTAIDVVVDSAERFAWTFPGARVTRRRLPVGDYALSIDDRLVAIVERKSLTNFLANVHEIKALHQQMAELGGYAHATVVVEAQYGDLAKPGKIGRWPPSHLLRVVGELAALHPKVPVVFAGNRKLGNAWTQRCFAAVAAAAGQNVPDLVREPLLRFDAVALDGGGETRIRVALLQDLPDGFTMADLRAACPDASDLRLRAVMGRVRTEGRLRREGAGRGVRWYRVPAPA